MAIVQGFLILSAIMNNVFYITKPKEIIEVYMCVAKENFSDQWPDQWQRMESIKQHGIPMFYMHITNISTVNYSYKLKMFDISRKMYDSEWTYTLYDNNNNNINMYLYPLISSFIFLICVIFSFIYYKNRHI